MISIEEFFEAYDSLILALAREALDRCIGASDCDDLAQEVRISLWRILARQEIIRPVAYIRRAIYNALVDLYRKEKPYQFLSTDDDGELDKGIPMVGVSKEFNNPEQIVEEEETAVEFLSLFVYALALLHTRQRHISVCRVLERVDNVDELKMFLAQSGLDPNVEMPIAKDDRQLLQASYSAARRNLASVMGVDLAEYAKRKG